MSIFNMCPRCKYTYIATKIYKICDKCRAVICPVCGLCECYLRRRIKDKPIKEDNHRGLIHGLFKR